MKMGKWKIDGEGSVKRMTYISYRTGIAENCGVADCSMEEVMEWLAERVAVGDNIVLPDGSYLPVFKSAVA